MRQSQWAHLGAMAWIAHSKLSNVMVRPPLGDLERLVVVVAANITLGHVHTPSGPPSLAQLIVGLSGAAAPGSRHASSAAPHQANPSAVPPSSPADLRSRRRRGMVPIGIRRPRTGETRREDHPHPRRGRADSLADAQRRHLLRQDDDQRGGGRDRRGARRQAGDRLRLHLQRALCPVGDHPRAFGAAHPGGRSRQADGTMRQARSIPRRSGPP